MPKTFAILIFTLVAVVFADQRWKSSVRTADFSGAWDAGAIRIGYHERPAPRTPWIPTAVWVMILGRMLVRAKRARTLETVAFSLVLAGGLSVLYDRWRYAAVRAPLMALLGGRQMLPFGLADLAISLGGIILCVLLAQEMITRPRRRRLQSAHS